MISHFFVEIFVMYLFSRLSSNPCALGKLFHEATILIKSPSLHTVSLLQVELSPQPGSAMYHAPHRMREALPALFPDVRSTIEFCCTSAMLSSLLGMPSFCPVFGPVTCAELMGIVFVGSRPLFQRRRQR